MLYAYLLQVIKKFVYMKLFCVNITAGFVLLFAAYLPSSAQKCNVKIIGTLCAGDTLNGNDSLQAIFTGGTLSNLIRLRSDKNSFESPVFNASVKTVAGGSGAGSAPYQLHSPEDVYVDKNYPFIVD